MQMYKVCAALILSKEWREQYSRQFEDNDMATTILIEQIEQALRIKNFDALSKYLNELEQKLHPEDDIDDMFAMESDNDCERSTSDSEGAEDVDTAFLNKLGWYGTREQLEDQLEQWQDALSSSSEEDEITSPVRGSASAPNFRGTFFSSSPPHANGITIPLATISLDSESSTLLPRPSDSAHKETRHYISGSPPLRPHMYNSEESEKRRKYRPRTVSEKKIITDTGTEESYLPPQQACK